MKTALIFTFSTLIFLSHLIAQENSNEWKLSGQIQLRSELDGRDFLNRTHPLKFTSLRTRVGIEKTFLDKVNFFVQIQDSRLFGQAGNTLASIDNIDLHQGYVVLKDLFDWQIDLQAGRFEAAYGTERFLGAVGWHYVGRAWDGVRVKYNGEFNLDFFGLTQYESVPYIGNATPAFYMDDEFPSARVFGFWATFGKAAMNRVDIFGYLDADKRRSPNDAAMHDRYTVGLNHIGNYSMVTTIAEVAFQFGKQADVDVSAYLASLQAIFNTGIWKFNAGADILSGTDPAGSSGKVNTFNPAYGTNHKFYGYMDYFINIPANTLMMGLNDFYAGVLLQPKDSKINVSMDFHHFLSNKTASFTGPENEVEKYSVFGQEIDLTLRYNFVKGTTITWGGSIFIPGDLMNLIFSGNDDPAFWTYLMITANL